MAKVISSASAKKAHLQAMPESEQSGPDLSQPISSQTISSQEIAQDRAYIGGYAYRIINKQIETITKLRSPVLADKDLEDLHQMRIGTRRLAAAVLLFQDEISFTTKKGKARAPEKLAKAVKKVTRALGRVRDLDVMNQWFIDVLESDKDNRFSKKEKKTIRALLTIIQKRRRKQFAKLETFLRGDRYKKLISQFKQWTKQPSFINAAKASAAEAAASKIIEPIANLLRHSGWLVASRRADSISEAYPDSASNITLKQLNQQLDQGGQHLHELRKQIKNVRYQAEFFRPLYGKAYASQVREFRTLQKILGGLQDQIVISQFLTNEISADWSKKLPTIAADFQNSRLDLWQQWQPYQEKYLELRSRLSEGKDS